jgi:hypothetical protein
VLILIITLVVVVPLGVVVLVEEGVELLPLGAIGDEVGGVTALKQPLGNLLLSLQNGCKTWNILVSRVILSLGMLSCCSSEAVTKEDKANFKADEIVMLVGLASWRPTWVLVIKALLVREVSWFGRPLQDNSWDLNLLNNFSVSRLAKSADSCRSVIFIPQTWLSRAYYNCLACSLLE